MQTLFIVINIAIKIIAELVKCAIDKALQVINIAIIQQCRIAILEFCNIAILTTCNRSKRVNCNIAIYI